MGMRPLKLLEIKRRFIWWCLFLIFSELWRKENNLQQNLSSLKEDLAKADQQLRSMAGKPILNGRDSVRKVLDTFIQRGGKESEIAQSYYGPVIENFDCEKSIYTAVEVTAGNRYFFGYKQRNQLENMAVV